MNMNIHVHVCVYVWFHKFIQHRSIQACVCGCVFTAVLGLASCLPVQGNVVVLPTNASLLWDGSFSVFVCVRLHVFVYVCAA